MTTFARILSVVGIVVVAYLVFFYKPREVFVEVPAEPQV